MRNSIIICCFALLAGCHDQPDITYEDVRAEAQTCFARCVAGQDAHYDKLIEMTERVATTDPDTMLILQKVRLHAMLLDKQWESERTKALIDSISPGFALPYKQRYLHNICNAKSNNDPAPLIESALEIAKYIARQEDQQSSRYDHIESLEELRSSDCEPLYDFIYCNLLITVGLFDYPPTEYLQIYDRLAQDADVKYLYSAIPPRTHFIINEYITQASRPWTQNVIRLPEQFFVSDPSAPDVTFEMLQCRWLELENDISQELKDCISIE